MATAADGEVLLIRSETDVGIIALLDKRFTYSHYMALFSAHWYTHSPSELITRNYQQALARFWAGHGKRASSTD